jgi:hypothetical protein
MIEDRHRYTKEEKGLRINAFQQGRPRQCSPTLGLPPVERITEHHRSTMNT